MVFDSSNSPNLISHDFHVSNEEKLLTISEKIIEIIKKLANSYIYPNIIVIASFIIIISFLFYRYKVHQNNKNKNYNISKKPYRPYNF